MENISKDGSMWSGGGDGVSSGGGSDSHLNSNENAYHYIGIINSWRKWPIFAGIGFGGERMLLLREPISKSSKKTTESVKNLLKESNEYLSQIRLNPFFPDSCHTKTGIIENGLKEILNKVFI